MKLSTYSKWLTTGFVSVATPVLGQQQQQPNVVLIITDQQSYNTISALSEQNSETFCSTPNIDRLVKRGTTFTDVYCSNPVSVPSRFSLFTGRYGGQMSIRENMCRGSKEQEVRAAIKETGMGNLFQKGGYETVYAGKVHLPYAGKRRNSKFAAPITYGFQQYLTKNEREEMSYIAADFLRKRKATDQPMLFVASFLNPHDICLEGKTNLSGKIKGNKPEKEKTIRELRAKASRYDSLSFYRTIAPHLPYNFLPTKGYQSFKCLKKKTKELPQWYWRKYRWTYMELVAMVDAYVGRVIDAVEANPNLNKNTYIIFTSDHGEMQGAHQLMAKSFPYEECQRVPLIISGPGVKAGELNRSSICNGVDLLPTLCELCHLPTSSLLEGYSFVAALLEQKEMNNRSIYIESEVFVSLVKDGFKYVLFDGEKNKEMLFNLRKDQGEKKNVMEQYPEVLIRMKQEVLKHEFKSVSHRKTKKEKKRGKKQN